MSDHKKNRKYFAVIQKNATFAPRFFIGIYGKHEIPAPATKLIYNI